MHRVAVETYGRKVPLSKRDSRNLVSLKKLSSLERDNRVSLYTGREILDLYRAQLPINPYVFTQLKKLTFDSEKTYLITRQREVFQILKNSLPGVRVYRDRRGHRFDGNWYPDAFILTSSMSPGELREKSVAELNFPEDGSSKKCYLLLENDHQLELFISGPPPEKEINVILPSPESSFPERFFNKLGEILRLEREVQIVKAGDLLKEAQLFLTELDLPADLYRGKFEKMSPYFYVTGLVVLGLFAVFLGAYHDEQMVIWLVWGVLILLSAPFYQLHKFSAGLLAAGFLRIGWKRKSRSLIWYFLTGIITFGLIYTSYLLLPMANSWTFWPGFAVGALLLTSLPAGWRKRSLRFEEIAYFILLLLIGYLLLYESSEYAELLLKFKAGLLIFLPLTGWFFPRWGYKRSFLKLFGMVGWLFLFLNGAGLIYLFIYTAGLVVWELDQIYLDPKIISQKYSE